MVLEHSLIAVLSGDIIRSTELSSDQLSNVRKHISEFSRLFGSLEPDTDQFIVGPDFFSGDGWQLACLKPELALRCAIYIRSSLMWLCNSDTRISIAIGRAEKVNHEEVSLSNGEAFTLSGRALQQLKTYNDLTIALPDRAGAVKEWTKIAAELCNESVRGWTNRQAEVVSAACVLWGKTHEEIGEGLTPPVSKQAVTKVLSSAHWRPISRMIELFGETDWPKVLENAK